MDLSTLANIGEFIGGMAVVATLAYLALQMRQNSRLQKLTIRQETANLHTQVNMQRIDPAVLSKAFTKLYAGEELDPEEAFSYSTHILLQVDRLEVAEYQFRQGFLDESEWNHVFAKEMNIFDQKLARELWQRHWRENSSPSIREMIDAHIATYDEQN
jgi:hypothetical protein